MRNGLDEFLRGGSCCAVKLHDLSGGGSCNAKRFTFCGELRNQTHALCARGVDTPACQKKVANKCVAQVALQARNAAEAWNQAEAQFGKRKTCHLVRHDDVACQSQFKSAAKAHTMNSSDRREWRGIDGVERGVNPLKKSAHPGNTLIFGELRSTVV